MLHIKHTYHLYLLVGLYYMNISGGRNIEHIYMAVVHMSSNTQTLTIHSFPLRKNDVLSSGRPNRTENTEILVFR